jgi:septum formation protein
VKPLVLASRSPRRQEILRNAAIPFIVKPSHVPEIRQDGEDPVVYAERLARDKALEVAKDHPENLVLGADTVVIVEGITLEKPQDATDAARMLRLLSGKTHQVTTAVCVVVPQPRTGNRKLRTGSETTFVTMSALTEDDIQGYIATGEPMDKAGAYAIQGIASRWISRIQGDYFNVVGLPVALVCRILEELRALPKLG